MFVNWQLCAHSAGARPIAFEGRRAIFDDQRLSRVIER